MKEEILTAEKKYDLDRMHQIKGGGRQQGKTVDAVAEAVGKIMVTENEYIPFVVSYMDRVSHIKKEFFNLCKSHFDETPVSYSQFEIGIKGYSSRIVFISSQDKKRLLGSNIDFVYDLD